MDNVDWIRAVDIDKPCMARVYDYLLGGFYNFEVDREAANKLIKNASPDAVRGVWAHRAFMRRAVRYCVAAGIMQFIDLGSGIPSRGNVHEIAEQANSECRTVYVDFDPAAVVHGRTMLESNERATIVHADLREPDAVLNSPEAKRLIESDKPVALLTTSVMHFVPGSDDPVGIIRRYSERLPSGSHLAMSHGNNDLEQQRDGAEVNNGLLLDAVHRSKTEVEALFAGFALVEPGVTWLEDSHPDPTGELFEQPPRFAYAGIGRKP